MPSANFHFNIRLPNGETVPAEIRYLKRAKNLTFRVNRPGIALVSAPMGLSRNFIKSQLAQFAPNLQKILEKISLDAPEMPETVSLPCLEKTIRVERRPLMDSMRKGDAAGLIRLENDILGIYGDLKTEELLPHVHKFFQGYATGNLPGYVESIAPEDARFIVFVRDQRTRMGSCSIKKDNSYAAPHISLNWRALLLPKELLRHLFMHELAHIGHMNHSAEFYARLEQLSPDCRVMEKRLNQAWKELPAWVFFRAK